MSFTCGEEKWPEPNYLSPAAAASKLFSKTFKNSSQKHLNFKHFSKTFEKMKLASLCSSNTLLLGPVIIVFSTLVQAAPQPLQDLWL